MVNYKRKKSKPVKKKLFLISTEGETEKQYFHYFAIEFKEFLTIKIISDKHSAPKHVLAKICEDLNQNNYSNYDAWVVIDKDQWPTQQINAVSEWKNSSRNNFFALSNPNFELWLLLHFKKNKIPNTAKGIINELKTHIPAYDKNINKDYIRLNLMKRLKTAISNAEYLDNPPCKYYPNKLGTTVYRLMQSILASVPGSSQGIA